MKKIISCCIFTIAAFTGLVYSSCEKEADPVIEETQLTPIEYRPSDAIIFNPERGFYKYTACHLSVDGPLQLSSLEAFRNSGYSLIYRIYYLKNFRDRELSEAALATLDQDMQALRQSGLKCILRFAYSENPEEPDAPISTIDLHLEQLRPWFAEYYDVIAVMQAGLIGAWGEWYYTSHNLNTVGARATVLNKILEVLPEERMVQVRTPQYKTDFLQNTAALLHDEAFSGTPKARIGHHNDCFLASETDYGTYQNVEAEKMYIHQDAQYVPVGGETCPPSGIEAADCEKAEYEMRFLRWSYLNEDYYNGVNDRWKDQGCMDDIRRELGYRLTLKRGEYSAEVSPGHSLQVQLAIENQGYASLFNPRAVELILIHEGTSRKYRLSLAEDPRTWKPATTTELIVEAGIPADAPNGTYRLYMSMPDPSPALYENPWYSIQLANEGTWQAGSGYNDLMMPVTIGEHGQTDEYSGSLIFQGE